MMITRFAWTGITFVVAAQLMAVAPVFAQPLGTFTWQLQPYCNRLTLTVVQSGGVFTLDGYDDQCGTTPATASGVAVLAADGSVRIGLTVITSEAAHPFHIDVTLGAGSLSGKWTDNRFDEGAFAFNAASGGSPRLTSLWSPSYGSGFHARARSGGGFFYGLAHNGPIDAPTATTSGDTLARFGGGGHTGTAFWWASGLMRMNATEDWTPSANGTQIQFWTTQNGTTGVVRRMVLDHNGYLGIGTNSPVDPLHVSGDIRTESGCVRSGSGGVIAGVCASDLRFKRDVTAAPAVLDRVRALRPVHFYWRADEFPQRAFGADQSYGLVADDVEAVLPEIVSIDADGFKRIDYSALPLLAIQAIGELKTENDRLAEQNAELAARIARIEAQLQRLLSAPR
jgi:hypothetical protein